MAVYAYTDIQYGVEETGMPKTIPAGSTLTAGKELTKEQIDILVETGAAGEQKRNPTAPNDTVGAAATLEDIEAGETQGKAVGAR